MQVAGTTAAMVEVARTRNRLPRLAWRAVGRVLLLDGVLLAVTITQYGYDRDELYFRVLAAHPSWGYVDQGPFTPLLARAGIAVFGDDLWALRIPAMLMALTAVVLTALLARELGGGAPAQTLAAVGVSSELPAHRGTRTAHSDPRHRRVAAGHSVHYPCAGPCAAEMVVGRRARGRARPVQKAVGVSARHRAGVRPAHRRSAPRVARPVALGRCTRRARGGPAERRLPGRSGLARGDDGRRHLGGQGS